MGLKAMAKGCGMLLAGVLLACGTPAPAAPGLGGWITYWNYEAGLKSVRAGKPELSNIYLFSVHLDQAGSPLIIHPEKDYAKAIAEFQGPQTRVWLTVVNDHDDGAGKTILKDAALMHAICGDPKRRSTHIQTLLELCQKFKVDGLDVDYENLNPEDKAPYSSFIGELAIALHAHGFKLSVTVQPKRGEVHSAGAGAADWRVIANAADQMQIMLYNEHNANTKPGPVATPAFMAKVLSFAETQCEKSKIIPVLKVSGYEWGKKAREVGIRDLAGQRAAQKGEPSRDPGSKTPYINYQISGEDRTAFYEDATSVRSNISFLNGLGYPTVTLWSLGVEDTDLWK